MGIIFNDLTLPTFILSILYLLSTLYGCRRLRHLHRQSAQLNTRKVFVMSCLLSTFLRFLSFGTMAALNFFNYEVKAQNTNGDESSTAAFFDKAALVLFDLPDFCVISAYILLLVVWAEAILASRKHWISTTSYRQRSLLVYLIFNIILYSIQVVLYMFMFVPSVDQKILVDLIYLTMGAINLGLPILWICAYMYLSLKFSGFPYHSTAAFTRMTSLNRIGSIWTLTRLTWGMVSLTTATNGWLQNGRYSLIESSVVLISIFCVCEIIPILISYRTGSLRTLVDFALANKSEVQSPLHFDEKSTAVDASVPFMAPEEISSEAMSKTVGEYFGASPLERSHTWASEDEYYAQSPHNRATMLSSDRKPADEPQESEANWTSWGAYFGF